MELAFIVRLTADGPVDLQFLGRSIWDAIDRMRLEGELTREEDSGVVDFSVTYHPAALLDDEI